MNEGEIANSGIASGNCRGEGKAQFPNIFYSALRDFLWTWGWLEARNVS